MFLAVTFAIVGKKKKKSSTARNTVSVRDDLNDLYLYFDVTLH